MSESDSNYTRALYESNLEIVLVDFWLFFTGVVNVAMNVLIIFTLLKSKLTRPLHMFILNISAIEIICQLFCPTVFKMFALSHDIFKDFVSHKVFTSVYFTGIYLVLLSIFMLLLRNYMKCIDRFYIYIIGALWGIGVIVFIVIILLFSGYYMRYSFIPPYVITLAILLIALHIHQIRTTLKFDEYSGRDYQISMLYVSSYVVSRLAGLMLFILGEIIYFGIPIIEDYFILGCIQLVSIGNFFILYNFEETFKNCSLSISGRQARRTNENGFQNLQEDYTLPE